MVPSAPSSPSYTRNTFMGFLLGMLAVCAIVVIQDMMDITIRVEEDLTRGSSHPVLATVPDMEGHTKEGYYYGSDRKKKKYEKADAKAEKKPALIGKGIGFAAAEAYKVLRTKLQFSFVDEGGCRVIGISSALTSEGKSLTAVNLAYSLSQLGERVLLVDCDMRRPTVAEKLTVKKSPGLSDFLAGQIQGEHLLQPCGIEGDANAFHVISAGRMPPNPMELLSSARMARMMKIFRDKYDYILLDLPPVGEVGDALAAAKLTDGILLVVRQNYCDRISLNHTINQFEFVGAKILGTVFNCTNEHGKGYGYNNKYYRKYYKKYYKTPYSYEARASAAKKDT